MQYTCVKNPGQCDRNNCCLNKKPLLPTTGPIRTFDTGANRNSDAGKLDYEGFFNPAVMQKWAEYMHKNRFLQDGSTRASDNWQLGIPKEECIKSLLRHVMDLWLEHRGEPSRETIDEALGAIMFNAQAYWLAVIRERRAQPQYKVTINDGLMPPLMRPQPLPIIYE